MLKILQSYQSKWQIFAHNKTRWSEIRPQMMFGYQESGSDFGGFSVKSNASKILISS